MILADGCFYHCCPKHGRVPDSNRAYWEPKLAGNVRRDRAPVDEATREGLRALHASHPLRALAAAAGLGASTVLRALRGGAVSSHAREALGALVRAVPSNPAGQRAA